MLFLKEKKEGLVYTRLEGFNVHVSLNAGPESTLIITGGVAGVVLLLLISVAAGSTIILIRLKLHLTSKHKLLHRETHKLGHLDVRSPCID